MLHTFWLLSKIHDGGSSGLEAKMTNCGCSTFEVRLSAIYFAAICFHWNSAFN